MNHPIESHLEPDQVLKKISDIYELDLVNGEMNDDDVDTALTLLIKLIARPDVPINRAGPLIVQLEALSMKFKLQAKAYMTYDKATIHKEKKNIYMSLADSLHELAGAVKYITK